MLVKNQVVHARIEDIPPRAGHRPGGRAGGVCPPSRPGEDCDILLLKVLKNTAFGKVMEIETPSAHRTEPDCPYYGKCGGCDFRHMDYAEELEAKRQRVQDALTRLGGSRVQVEKILGAPVQERYRNRACIRFLPTVRWAFTGHAPMRCRTLRPAACKRRRQMPRQRLCGNTSSSAA